MDANKFDCARAKMKLTPLVLMSLHIFLLPSSSLAENIIPRTLSSSASTSASNEITRQGLVSQLKGAYQERMRKLGNERALTADKTAFLTITLDASDTTGTPQDSDFESWLCAMDSFWTKHLMNELAATTLYEAKYAKWTFDASTKTATITAESSANKLELFTSSVTAIDSEDLMVQLTTNVGPDDVTKAVQGALGEDNFFKNAEILEYEVTVEDATTTGSTYFHTGNCGMASATFNYGFFAGTDVTSIPESDIGNLLCSTAKYYQDILAEYANLGSQGFGGRGEQEGIRLTLDRASWSIDPAAETPFSITMDVSAVETSSHRQIDALDILTWIQESDFAAYIKDAVWLAYPEETNFFYETNTVNFKGNIRSSTAEPPEQSMSTDWCIDGVMGLPDDSVDSAVNGTAGEPSSDSGDEDDSEELSGRVASFVFTFLFESGKARPPSDEEIEGLICQTSKYFHDKWSSSAMNSMFAGLTLGLATGSDASPNKGQSSSLVDSFVLEARTWNFDSSDEYPLAIQIAAKGWNKRGEAIAPSTMLEEVANTMDVQSYITNYTWTIEPKGESVFYHTMGFKYSGSTITLSGDDAGASFYSSTACGRDDRGNKLGACLPSLMEADADQDMHLSENEFLHLVDNLAEETNESSDSLLETFQSLASSADGIDLNENSEQICEEILKVIKSVEGESVRSGGLELHKPNKDKDIYENQVTVFSFQYGFEDGHARAPTDEEMKNIICQMTSFYDEMWFSEMDPSITTGPDGLPLEVVDDLLLEVTAVTFDELLPQPLSVVVETKAWDTQGRHISPAVMMNKLQVIGDQSFITDYAWKTPPEGESNLFHFTSSLAFDFEVKSDDGDSSNAVLFSSQDCPKFTSENITAVELDRNGGDNLGRAKGEQRWDGQVGTYIFSFGFEPGEARIPINDEMESLICHTIAYYKHLWSSNSTSSDVNGIDEFVMGASNWTFDPSSSTPLSLTIHTRAWDNDGEEIPSGSLIHQMKEMDVNDYVPNFVWSVTMEAGQSVFFYTKEVSFNGFTGPGPGNEAILFSGDNCQGVYNADSADGTVDRFENQVTTYTFNFVFEEGEARLPTEEEIQGLICKTASYYADLWLNTSLELFVIEAGNWTYDDSYDMPLTIRIDARAWDSEEKQVSPGEVLVEMNHIDVQSYIMDYIWHIAPEGKDNVFYYTSGMTYQGTVRSRHDDEGEEIEHTSKTCPEFAKEPPEESTRTAGLDALVGLLDLDSKPEHQEVTVDASFLVTAPKGTPVDNSIIDAAFSGFVQGMQQEPFRSRKLSGRKMPSLSSILETDSAQVEVVNPVDCPDSEQQADKDCYEAYAKYNVLVASDEDPEEVQQAFTLATQSAIADGQLEESLMTVSPETPMVITADKPPPQDTSGEEKTAALPHGEDFSGELFVQPDLLADHLDSSTEDSSTEDSRQRDKGCGIFKGAVCEAVGLGGTISIILVIVTIIGFLFFVCVRTARDMKKKQRTAASGAATREGLERKESDRIIKDQQFHDALSELERGASHSHDSSNGKEDEEDAQQETAQEEEPVKGEENESKNAGVPRNQSMNSIDLDLDESSNHGEEGDKKVEEFRTDY